LSNCFSTAGPKTSAEAEPPSFIKFNGEPEALRTEGGRAALRLKPRCSKGSQRSYGVGINPTRRLHKISKSLLTHSGVLCDKLLSGLFDIY